MRFFRTCFAGAGLAWALAALPGSVGAQWDLADEGFFPAQAGPNRGKLGFQLIIEGMKSVMTPVIEGIASE